MINVLKRWYLTIEKYFLFAIFILMGLNVAIQVVLRYFFNSPLPFGEELARYLQIWLTFFGLAYVLRQNGHIRMEAVYNKMSSSVRMVVDIITNLSVLSALILAFPGTIEYFQNQIPVHWLGIPFLSMAVTAFCMPAGTIILIFYYIANTVKLVRSLFFAPQVTSVKEGE